MSKLAGKVALVTGASKGIGAAIAKALAGEGAAVAVNYASSREGADRVVGEITAAGGRAVAVQADVSKPADVRRMFEETKKAFGPVGVLVNNAGVYRFGSIEDVTPEEFHRQFDTNVLGPILAIREAVQHFGAEGGNVINVGSLVSEKVIPNSVVYSATKSALDSVTRVLAAELGSRNIRVNSINPGGVETEGTHSAGIIGSAMEQEMIAQTPLGRLGQPNDIAPLAAFLASADSGWITGETFVASGGLR